MKWAVESGIKPLPGGGVVFLAAGWTTADDDHPLVVQHPTWWADVPPAAHLSTVVADKVPPRPGPPRPPPRAGRPPKPDVARGGVDGAR